MYSRNIDCFVVDSPRLQLRLNLTFVAFCLLSVIQYNYYVDYSELLTRFRTDFFRSLRCRRSYWPNVPSGEEQEVAAVFAGYFINSQTSFFALFFLAGSLVCKSVSGMFFMVLDKSVCVTELHDC